MELTQGQLITYDFTLITSKNWDSRTEIPGAWMFMIKKHNVQQKKQYNSRPLREQLLAGTMEQWED